MDEWNALCRLVNFIGSKPGRSVHDEQSEEYQAWDAADDVVEAVEHLLHPTTPRNPKGEVIT
jgi:hypothetical protein